MGSTDFFGYLQQGTRQGEVLRQLEEVALSSSGQENGAFDGQDLLDYDDAMTDITESSQAELELREQVRKALYEKLNFGPPEDLVDELIQLLQPAAFIEVTMDYGKKTRINAQRIIHFEETYYREPHRGTTITWETVLEDRRDPPNFFVKRRGTVIETVAEILEKLEAVNVRPR